jgi:hypothetical protein
VNIEKATWKFRTGSLVVALNQKPWFFPTKNCGFKHTLPLKYAFHVISNSRNCQIGVSVAHVGIWMDMNDSGFVGQSDWFINKQRSIIIHCHFCYEMFIMIYRRAKKN